MVKTIIANALEGAREAQSIEHQFKRGWSEGSESIDKAAREDVYDLGYADGLAGREPATMLKDQADLDALSSTGATTTAEGAHAAGWELGWHAESLREYHKGHAMGSYARASDVA